MQPPTCGREGRQLLRVLHAQRGVLYPPRQRQLLRVAVCVVHHQAAREVKVVAVAGLWRSRSRLSARW